MNRMVLAAALVGILASACSPAPLDPAAGPADPDAQMRPDLIVADPAPAAPGAIVGLHFPQETMRGILFVLERRVGDTWVHEYNLTSDGPGPGWRMAWHVLGEEGFAVEDIGVGGAGPDHVTIPDVAEPGDYRICTGNAGDEICTPFEIVAP
jgi:hypothetical protein